MKCFESTVTDVRDLNVGEPVLPRFRVHAIRFGGDTQYEFCDPVE